MHCIMAACKREVKQTLDKEHCFVVNTSSADQEM